MGKWLHDQSWVQTSDSQRDGGGRWGGGGEAGFSGGGEAGLTGCEEMRWACGVQRVGRSILRMALRSAGLMRRSRLGMYGAVPTSKIGLRDSKL